jgi:hypothetical protein
MTTKDAKHCNMDQAGRTGLKPQKVHGRDGENVLLAAACFGKGLIELLSKLPPERSTVSESQIYDMELPQSFPQQAPLRRSPPYS